MAKCLCSVSKPWFFILLLFLYSVQKRIDTQKNESERARKAFCYCFSFLSILNLHVYINLNFTRLRFEFDITWLNVCVLKTLNFWLLIFLLFCLEKRINVPKNPKNNENERAGKAVYSCSNFLSISNLLINLNFVRARFEFNIKWLNVCDLKTLNFRLLSFLLFYIKKRINVQKNENERACEPFCKVPLLLPSSLWLLELQKLEKHMGINVRLFQRAVCFSLNKIHAHRKKRTYYALNPMSNLRVIFFAVVFWLHDLRDEPK